MATNNLKPVHSLILDSGPIIKNDPVVSTLIAKAEKLYTIPAVIDELRDPATRERIENTLLPFLTLRSPKTASVKAVSDFARKTGDLEVLSRTDLHVLALTYELECERNNGDRRLRNVPGQKRLNGEMPAEDQVQTQNAPAVVADNPVKPVELAPAPVPKTNIWGALAPATTVTPSQPPSDDFPSLKAAMENTQISSSLEIPPAPKVTLPRNTIVQTAEAIGTLNSVPEPPTEDLSIKQPEDTQENNSSEIPSDQQPEEDEDDSEFEGSDGEGWITPSNIKKVQEKDANANFKPSKLEETMEAAIITTDFAMQNVALRMNLHLVSSSLMRIQNVKSWVLRCHACFYVTKDMAKQFCTRCGKPTMLRVSCSTDSKGVFRLHLKRNMQWNTRGNVYSVPKPIAGTSNGKIVSGGGKGGWGQSLILAEDQKEFVNAMTSARRTKEKDLMDEDYLPNLLSGDRGRIGGRPKIGAGRNINAKKRK